MFAYCSIECNTICNTICCRPHLCISDNLIRRLINLYDSNNDEMFNANEMANLYTSLIKSPETVLLKVSWKARLMIMMYKFSKCFCHTLFLSNVFLSLLCYFFSINYLYTQTPVVLHVPVCLKLINCFYGKLKCT